MKGCKGILSNTISNSLGEYFAISPEDVETNLISDAGVTLHHVQLKPIEGFSINEKTKATITGTVDEVAFHWEWGQDSHAGGSGWVKNAQLTINGLKCNAILSPCGTDCEEDDTTTGESKPETAPASGIKGYVQDQLNRIMDTLTLSITSYEFRLEVPSSRAGSTAVQALVFGGEGLNIESLGRHVETDTLKQTIRFDKIFSNIVTSRTNVLVPDIHKLLDPISYTTNCVRVGGKRFDAGIATGMTIRGESNDDGVVVHTGKQQLSFLNQLGGMLTSSKNQEKLVKSQHNELSLTCDMHSSFFKLPMAAVSLVLPNNTKISMAGLVLMYQMDGSICSLEGQDGFHVNDFPMLAIDGSCKWKANVVDSHFNVGGATKQIVAMVHARDEEIDSVKEGISDLVSIHKSIQSEGALALITSKALSPEDVFERVEKVKQDAEQDTAASKDEIQKSWSISVDGGMGFLHQGSDDTIKVDCLFHHIEGSMQTMSASIGMVEKFYIPDTVRLSKPLENITLTFDGTLFDLNVGDIVAQLEEPPLEFRPDDDALVVTTVSSKGSDEIACVHIPPPSQAGGPPFVLPFGGKVTINSITVYETDGETEHTSIKKIEFAFGPEPSEDEETPTGGLRSILMVEAFKHAMIELAEPQVSAVIHLNNMDTIDTFQFDAKAISVAAGYSIFDWKRLFETGDEKREKNNNKTREKEKKSKQPIKLPDAHIDQLKIKVVVKGDVVGFKGSTINIKQFSGNKRTTMDDVVRFYSSAVISNVPGMVTNADVLGFNVFDTAGGYVGSTVGAGALSALGSAAAPVAGVLGIAGFDGIKGTINKGKKARGKEADDPVKCGDFFRGIGQATKDAASSGAKQRGKGESDKASAIDWAVGSTSGAAKYSSKNKARLGGAGAGTAGFVYGMVLGGPVGAIAGSLIASTATKSTIDAVDHGVSG